ncbi:protein of unknown function [Actinomadura meyerae]|jgi:hypothetical protein|uniref:DUF397 domain-containing protein n=1 Tax=Actinomadura meyerae TaxID=240840 RepID=A0A239P283_9ACTN|nr:DUF397 domain-containing protein [Actinomadura meyerae]SNT61195.1 protein of unknown function [Actinomadura meyerae]
MITRWRKSAWSDDYGNCVELAGLSDAIAIRDSKAPRDPHLTLTRQAFAALIDHIKRGELSI